MGVQRTIRGMLPRKIQRGDEALLRVTHLRPDRRFCVLGRLSNDVGWKHWDLVKQLEAKRKVASKEFYETKKAANRAREEALAGLDLGAAGAVLEASGY